MTAWNFCPICGHRIYQHDSGGCSHVETTGHIARIDLRDGFILKHPAAERENDRLFDCPIHTQLTNMSGLPQPGDYAIIFNDCGGWSFEPPEKARTPCSCIITPHFFPTKG